MLDPDGTGIGFLVFGLQKEGAFGIAGFRFPRLAHELLQPDAKAKGGTGAGRRLPRGHVGDNGFARAMAPRTEVARVSGAMPTSFGPW